VRGEEPATLKELRDALLAGRYDEPSDDSDGGDLWENHNTTTELPTFGGEEPSDTNGVWSWDETHLLIGEGGDDFVIVPRD
jgi:hypothetical protein